MRSTIGIILGFLILFGTSFYLTYKITNTSETFLDQNKQTETLIRQSKWDEAGNLTRQTYSSWKKEKSWWAIVLNHNILNNIEASYLRLEQYISTRQKALSLSELSTLTVLLKEVPESQSVRLNNVL